jgi:hypothetical protein
MMRRTLQFVLVLFVLASVAWAQTSGAGVSGGGTMGTLTIDGLPRSFEPPVTGAPFSADVVVNNPLNSAPTSPIHLSRDSAGRTRTEQNDFYGLRAMANPPTLVDIVDPVAGYEYLLYVEGREAHRFKLGMPKPPELHPIPADGVPRPLSGPQWSSWFGSPPANWLPWPSNSTSEGIINCSTWVSFEIVESVLARFTTESLGKRTIDGVLTEGSRISSVPAKAEPDGLRRLATSVMEWWFAPELKLTVLVKLGESVDSQIITQLKNINRSEPASTLFQVPSNYKVIDEKGSSFTWRIVRP